MGLFGDDVTMFNATEEGRPLVAIYPALADSELEKYGKLPLVVFMHGMLDAFLRLISFLLSIVFMTSIRANGPVTCKFHITNRAQMDLSYVCFVCEERKCQARKQRI